MLTTLLEHPAPSVAMAADAARSLAAAYEAHHTGAVRLAYLLTGDRWAAEDAVADVWVKVHRAMGRGPIDDVGAYVRRAVVNQVHSRWRRLGVARAFAGRRTGDDRGSLGVEDVVAERDAVVAALARLPERTRAAVVLRYYEDLSVADTAAALGISEGAVKSSTNRGLAALRTYLEGSR